MLSFGNFYVQFGNDFRLGYVLSDSPSAEEHAIYRAFFNFSSNPYMVRTCHLSCNLQTCLSLSIHFVIIVVKRVNSAVIG